jgi:hypothetical protein
LFYFSAIFVLWVCEDEQNQVIISRIAVSINSYLNNGCVTDSLTTAGAWLFSGVRCLFGAEGLPVLDTGFFFL